MRTMTSDIGEGARGEGGTPAARPAADADARGDGEEPVRSSGFLRRYRLPLALGVIALCLYAGSILYILYGRGQIA